MTTGSFWNVSNPLKPWGYHDKNSVIIYPFDWAAWLADSGTTYASHTVTAEDPLEVTATSQADGVIRATVATKSGGTPTQGQKYAITCRIVAANGETEDQTVYLKIREK